MIPEILIIVEGGLVQDVVCISGQCRVRVHDYDVEGSDPEDIETNDEGEEFLASDYGTLTATPMIGH
jgi:hypothetical protein